MTTQAQIPGSLDFPNRTTVNLPEMAAKLGVTVRHLQRQAEGGSLPLVDVRSRGALRPRWRVPIDVYRDYVRSRLKGRSPVDVLASLPEPTCCAAICDLVRRLPADTRSRLLRDLQGPSAA